MLAAALWRWWGGLARHRGSGPHTLTLFRPLAPGWRCTAKCTTYGSWRVEVTAR